MNQEDVQSTPLLPWSVAPCQCVVTHVPKPVMTELHHLFPMMHQKRIWGEVRDHERVSLCSSGHENVHSMLTKILKGELPGPAAGNEYLRWVVEEGARRVRAAKGEPTTWADSVEDQYFEAGGQGVTTHD